MSNHLEYKGYIGKVELDDDAGILHGSIINTAMLSRLRVER